MGTLSTWLEQLGFLVLFGSLVEIILPDDDIRKTVRLVVGLVIVLAVIEPFAGWVGDPILPAAAEPPVVEADAFIEAGRALAWDGVRAAQDVWVSRFERELTVVLSLLEGVWDARVDAVPLPDGAIGELHVLVVPAAEAEGADPLLRARVTKTVQRLAPGISKEAISVEIEDRVSGVETRPEPAAYETRRSADVR